MALRWLSAPLIRDLPAEDQISCELISIHRLHSSPIVRGSASMAWWLLSSSPLSFSPALIIAIVIFLYIALQIRSSRGYAPIAGTAFHQLLNFHRLYDYHTDLFRKHKTFRILVTPFQSYVSNSDPANIEYILKTNFDNYGKGSVNYEKLEALFGDGIFAVDGTKWRQQRKVASHEFSAKVLRDFSSSVFRSNTIKLARIISTAAAPGSERAFDMQELLLRSSMDSIFQVGFGVDLETLTGSSKEFTRAFEDASYCTLLRYLDITWKIKRFLNIGSEAKLRKDMEVINNFTYELIHARAQQLSTARSDSMGKEDILSRFLLEQQKDPEGWSNEYLKDIILNFIIAGRDTTAGTLAWFFYAVCKNPQVQERIVEEVKTAARVELGLPFEEFEEFLTEEAMSGMHYLHAALSETLRLYPGVPMNGKTCFSDDVLPDGCRVRKGDMVDYQPYAMGRMERLWGPDAELFKPERWLDEDGVFQPESPFKFTAFQGGYRICLGKDFAYRQMKIVAATLLYLFRFRLQDEKMTAGYRVMLTLHMRDGLQMLAVPRGMPSPEVAAA